MCVCVIHFLNWPPEKPRKTFFVIFQILLSGTDVSPGKRAKTFIIFFFIWLSSGFSLVTSKLTHTHTVTYHSRKEKESTKEKRLEKPASLMEEDGL